MIPDERLSTTPLPAAFYGADAIEPPSAVTDYELGGVALNDPSQGLQTQTWTSWYDEESGDVMISAPGIPAVALFNAPGVTELSFTFDQNMRPFHAYVQGGQAKYRWFDTILGDTRISNLDADDYSPRCCFDDKRALQTAEGTNDIILAYVRGGALYYRQQRERFETERELSATVPGRFLRVGMSVTNRLQFLFEGT